jgi:hypothetical protein
MIFLGTCSGPYEISFQTGKPLARLKAQACFPVGERPWMSLSNWFGFTV